MELCNRQNDVQIYITCASLSKLMMFMNANINNACDSLLQPYP